MPKYWSGLAFERGKIVRDGREQEYVIAMTEEEAKDRSYLEQLHEAQAEKTADWFKRHPVQEPKEGSREALGELMREMSEYKRRKQESPNRKYF